MEARDIHPKPNEDLVQEDFQRTMTSGRSGVSSVCHRPFHTSSQGLVASTCCKGCVVHSTADLLNKLAAIGGAVRSDVEELFSCNNVNARGRAVCALLNPGCTSMKDPSTQVMGLPCRE